MECAGKGRKKSQVRPAGPARSGEPDGMLVWRRPSEKARALVGREKSGLVPVELTGLRDVQVVVASG